MTTQKYRNGDCVFICRKDGTFIEGIIFDIVMFGLLLYNTRTYKKELVAYSDIYSVIKENENVFRQIN